MMYLGTLGRMVGIKCPTAQRVNHAERYSFKTTLGGTVKAQAGPVGRRTWDVSLGSLTTPSEVGTLMDFATGAWGPGPFWFVSADAPVVNLLPPQVASSHPDHVLMWDGARLLGSPPISLGDHGVAARTVWKTSEGMTVFGDPVPVLPGTPVTAAAWLPDGGQIRLAFLDSTGSTVREVRSSPPVSATDRVSITETPPADAVSARLYVAAGTTRVARPSITWTDQPYEWGDGQGCNKAVVHESSRDVTKAWDDPKTGRWSSMQFIIRELG